MTLIRRNSPLGELVTVRHAMDRLFDDSFVRARPRPRAWAFTMAPGGALPIDIKDSSDAFVVEAALPGVKPDDVQITVEDRTLTIRADSREEREETKGETLVSEIRRGSVHRTVGLPSGLEPDKATATFENGVLRLSIPRAEAGKPRQIRITPTIAGQATIGAPAESPAAESPAAENTAAESPAAENTMVEGTPVKTGVTSES